MVEVQAQSTAATAPVAGAFGVNVKVGSPPGQLVPRAVTENAPAAPAVTEATYFDWLAVAV